MKKNIAHYIYAILAPRSQCEFWIFLFFLIDQLQSENTVLLTLPIVHGGNTIYWGLQQHHVKITKTLECWEIIVKIIIYQWHAYGILKLWNTKLIPIENEIYEIYKFCG